VSGEAHAFATEHTATGTGSSRPRRRPAGPSVRQRARLLTVFAHVRTSPSTRTGLEPALPHSWALTSAMNRTRASTG
jgi:hypothetical protein